MRLVPFVEVVALAVSPKMRLVPLALVALLEMRLALLA